jgi:hypothetical protein
MRESTSTSDPLRARTPYAAAALAALLALACAEAARAQEPPAGGAAPAPNGRAPSPTDQPEEDDYSGSPYTKYGEFNEDADEDEDTRFFQYGRFFGVSVGLGLETVDGNRGTLWQGGFPMVDVKIHYWFDFNFALDMGIFTAKHFFEGPPAQGGHTDVTMLRLGVDIKYYFDTKNLSAPISFANPYLLAGVGSFTKTQNYQLEADADPDSSFGFSFGGGLEFTLKPRKAYFALEGKIHVVTFKDTNSSDYSSIVPDLNGNFYTFSASLLFTW